jgi:hypothetical protein
MGLSKKERRAWEECEQSLVGHAPLATDTLQGGEQWMLTVSSAACRTVIPKLILVVGVVVLLLGALAGVPLFVITGTVVLGTSIGRMYRRTHEGGPLQPRQHHLYDGRRSSEAHSQQRFNT